MPTKHRRKHHSNNPLPSVPTTTTTATSVLLPPINVNPSPPTPTGITAIPTSPFPSSGTAATPPTPLERTNINMKECDNGMVSDVDDDDDDGVASTGARTTLGTYSTLSILSNDGVLPYDIGGATNDAVHSRLLQDEAYVINSTTATTAAAAGNEQHHNSKHRHSQSQHHQPVVLTSSALLVSVPSTPLSAASSIPFPNHHHRHHSSSVYRPVPLFSNMKLETATHLANVKRSTVSECITVDGVDEALLAESSQSPYVHTPHPKPPSLVSPVGATGTPASSPNKLLSDKTITSSISATIPPTPVVGQTLKYQATREWVGTAPDPTAGGAGALSPDSLHLSITSRTNTLIAAGFDLIGGGGGDTSPNALSGGSAWNAELEFDWASCSPGGESSARNQQHQPGAHISTSPSGCRSNSNGDGVAVGGGGGMGVYTTYSRCTSALSEPTSGVERLDENAAKLPTLPHYRPPSFSREASEQQLGETASTASGMSNNHPRVRVPAIPTILAGACPDQPPEPQDDLSEEDREAILNNNRSPPLYLLNRQMQAQQLLQCYLAFSAAEKLFGSARVSYATGGKGSDPLKRNRFLVSAAAAASAFHMFGGGALAGHPTAASLAAANFRSVFAAAAALQSSSSSLKQQGVVPPNKINTTTGKNILSSVLYGHSSNQTQYAGSMSAAFSVPGFHNISNPAAGGGAAAAQKRAAAMRAVPLSPDQERNTYFPLHNTNSAATVTATPMGHSKRIEPSKLDRQPLPARTTMPPSSYPTPNTTAAVPAVNTTTNHVVNDDNDNGDDDDSLSDVFGGDSFDTWVSGVVLQSQGHLISTNNISTNILPSPNQRHNLTVSKLRTNEEVVDDQSSEGAVLVDHPDDSSSLANHQQFVNQPHEKFSAVMKQPFARRGGGQLPQRVMSWNSGLSTSKARTDDWDVLSPSQQFRQKHRPNTEYDVCSVSPSAASGTTRQQATQNAAELVLGSNSSGVVVGRIGDLSSSTVSAAAQSTASPIIPPRRGGGGAAAFSSCGAEPISPTPRTTQQQPVSLSGGGGVGMKRVASSWASISSGGRRAAPNVDASHASSAAIHQYQMDDF